jgi:hypothetical protein
VLRKLNATPSPKRKKLQPTRQLGKLLAQAIRKRRNELLAWNLAHPRLVADPAIFEPIRTGFVGIALGLIVAVTGLSKSHAQAVRSGKKVPHARHWAAPGRAGRG